jgi:hypothetical protein
MHYKDGTPAKLFDIVKGTPYNIHPQREVVGVVVSLNPNVSDDKGSCGLQVAFTDVQGAWSDAPPVVVTRADYGTVGDFELVHRPTVGCTPEQLAWAYNENR